MRIQSYLCALALLGITAFSSCKKKDDNNANPKPSSGNLTAGTAAITFNTDADFAGTTSYNPAKPIQTIAVRQTSGGGIYDQITLTVQDVDYSNVANITSRNSQFVVYVATNASTANGPINAKFENTSSDAVWPTMVISATRGTNANDALAFASKTGTVIITKLTSTEIEGTFDGHFVNEDKGTSINLSNGGFAGKFK